MQRVLILFCEVLTCQMVSHSEESLGTPQAPLYIELHTMSFFLSFLSQPSPQFAVNLHPHIEDSPFATVHTAV